MLRRFKQVLVVMFGVGACYADGGYFAGLGVGYGSTNSTLQSGYVFSNGVGGSATSSNIASTFYFGYDFNQYVGLEGDYNVLYDANVANSYGINQNLVGLSIIGHLPFGLFTPALSKLSLMGKVGLQYNVVGFNGTYAPCANCVTPPEYYPGVSQVYGAGIEFDFNQNWGIRGEYNYQTDIVVSNQSVSQVVVGSNLYLLSAIYHF